MPNHIANRLHVTRGADLVREAFKGTRAFSDEKSDFTFNAIVPMEKDKDNPKYLNCFRCQKMNNGPDNFDWYTWSCDHWGTKWDAYNVEFDDSNRSEFLVYFNTAWTPPYQIYIELIKKFGHKIEFTVYAEDEDPSMGTVYLTYCDTKNGFKELMDTIENKQKLLESNNGNQ